MNYLKDSQQSEDSQEVGEYVRVRRLSSNLGLREKLILPQDRLENNTAANINLGGGSERDEFKQDLLLSSSSSERSIQSAEFEDLRQSHAYLSSWQRRRRKLMSWLTLRCLRSNKSRIREERRQKREIFDLQKQRQSQILEQISFTGQLIQEQDILDKIPVFEQGSLPIILWEILTFIITLYFLFIIPIESFILIFFNNLKKSDIIEENLVIFALVVYSIDLVLQFNVSCSLQGIIVLDRKKIMLNYLSFQFPVNLICLAVLLFNYVVEIDSFSSYSMIFLLKIISVAKLGLKFDDILRNRFYLKSLKSILSNLSIVLLLGHILGCCFLGLSIYLIRVKNYPESVTWAGSYQVYLNGQGDHYSRTIYKYLEDLGPGSNISDWITPYMFGLYWSLSMIITLGSNVSPCNPFEVLFQIIAEFFSCVLFGFLINTVYTIWQELAGYNDVIKFLISTKKTPSKQMFCINQFMIDKQVDVSLKNKVMTYVSYICQMENMRNQQQEQMILNKLPAPLRNQLLQDSYGKIFKQLSILKDNFSTDILSCLGQCVEEVYMGTGELLMRQGNDNSLYFVVSGEIDEIIVLPSYNQGEGVILQKLGVNKFFGEVQFFSGQSDSIINYRSKSFCHLYKLDRRKFIQLLVANSEQDFEKFIQIRDKIQFQYRYDMVGIGCSICSKNHCLGQCDKAQLSYSVTNRKVIQIVNSLKHPSQLDYQLQNHELMHLFKGDDSESMSPHHQFRYRQNFRRQKSQKTRFVVLDPPLQHLRDSRSALMMYKSSLKNSIESSADFIFEDRFESPGHNNNNEDAQLSPNMNSSGIQHSPHQELLMLEILNRLDALQKQVDHTRPDNPPQNELRARPPEQSYQELQDRWTLLELDKMRDYNFYDKEYNAASIINKSSKNKSR